MTRISRILSESGLFWTYQASLDRVSHTQLLRYYCKLDEMYSKKLSQLIDGYAWSLSLLWIWSLWSVTTWELTCPDLRIINVLRMGPTLILKVYQRRNNCVHDRAMYTLVLHTGLATFPSCFHSHKKSFWRYIDLFDSGLIQSVQSKTKHSFAFSSLVPVYGCPVQHFLSPSWPIPRFPPRLRGQGVVLGHLSL